MPLHAMPVEPGGEVPDYAPLDAAAASASGVPATPTGHAVARRPRTRAPCRAKVGRLLRGEDRRPTGEHVVRRRARRLSRAGRSAGGRWLRAGLAGRADGLPVRGPAADRGPARRDRRQEVWHRTDEGDADPAGARAADPAARRASRPRARRCGRSARSTSTTSRSRGAARSTGSRSAIRRTRATGRPIGSAGCSSRARRAGQGHRGPAHPLALVAALVDSGGAKVLFAEGPGRVRDLRRARHARAAGDVDARPGRGVGHGRPSRTAVPAGAAEAVAPAHAVAGAHVASDRAHVATLAGGRLR